MHVYVCHVVPQMAIWILYLIVSLWTATSHLPYPAVRNQLKRRVLKLAQRIHKNSVQKTQQVLKREPQALKKPVQVRNRQIEVYVQSCKKLIDHLCCLQFPMKHDR